MSKKLHVGNLPEGCTKSDLREFFESVGQVTECDVIKHYGFVHMATETECQEAVTQLDQAEFMGSQIRVQFSTSSVHKEADEGGRSDKCFNCGESGHFSRDCTLTTNDRLSRKLFVGNLPSGCSNADLKQHFLSIGEVVECDVIKNYGFVHMSTVAEAQQAVAQLNGTNMFGSEIRVQRATGERQGGSGASDGQRASKKLFVGNLSDGCTNGDLRQLFETIGQVTECDVLRNYGFVHMSTVAEAQQAVDRLNGTKMFGLEIRVQRATGETSRRQGGSGASDGQRATKKLFVGNLSDGCTNSELRQFFETVGPVTECDVLRNYGFVHMASESACQEAVSQLDQAKFQGTIILVKFSISSVHKTTGKGSRGECFVCGKLGHFSRDCRMNNGKKGGGGPEIIMAKKLFVGNLPDGCTNNQLRSLFQSVGHVTECDVLKNFGFVHMGSYSDALAAIQELNGHKLMDKDIRVQHATTEKGASDHGRGGGRGGMDRGGRGRGGMGRGGRGRGGGRDYGEERGRDYYDQPARRPPPPDPYYDRYDAYDRYDRYDRYEDGYSRRPPPYPYSRDYDYPPSYRGRSRSPPPGRRPLTPPRYQRREGSPPPIPRGYYDYPPERYAEAKSRYPPPPPPRPRYSPPPAAF